MRLLFLLVMVLVIPVTAHADTFTDYLETPYPAADGFDVVSEGPGAIQAIGRGSVVSVSDGAVSIEHIYYENHHRRSVRSRYAGLSRVDVVAGDIVKRRQAIGVVDSGRARIDLLDTDTTLRDFAKARANLFLPSEEPVLLIVEHATHRMARYERGRRTDLVEVGFGQAVGRKRRQGDLKTPMGMYFVVSKYRGEFSGKFGNYYGGHWIKLSYPNRYDARYGLRERLISSKTARRIRAKWERRALPTQKTKLGGGIGFHGWAGPWRLEDGGGLSWGCIVLHNADIKRLFDQIPKGAMVVIL